MKNNVSCGNYLQVFNKIKATKTQTRASYHTFSIF